MIDILHLKDNWQSQHMQQGLEDERKIIIMYEEILGCKVNKEGFIISSTCATRSGLPADRFHTEMGGRFAFT